MGKVIAAALLCPVGAGNAEFRMGRYTGYVDTVSYCGFRKWIFDRIGLFDEELVRNQDDDFSFRILQAGGKIYMDNSIHYDYFARGSILKLFMQYFQYGTWRIRTIQKHGRPATLRQIVPLGFVSLWILLAVGALFSSVAAGALIAYAGLYALALMVGAVQVARRAGWRYAPAAPLAFMAMHFGYGIGSLYGIFVFCLRPSRRAKPQKHPPAP
jgi:GT2 family glycosyltransferase